MGDEFVVRCPELGVAIPQNVLLHEYVLHRDYYGNDRAAFVDGVSGRTITHQQVRTMTKNIAAGLHSLGIRHKDVVMLLLPNVPEYAALFLGINRAGAVATTANPAYTPEELAKQAADSSTKLVITVSELLPKTSLMAPGTTRVSFGADLPTGVLPMECLLEADGRHAPSTWYHSPKDTCALPYSSGTTGVAKGVMLSHRNFIANIEQQLGGVCPRFRAGPEDTLLGVLPMFHIYGLNVLLLTPLRAGARVVSLPRFDMGLVLSLIQKERITVAPLVPPIILGLTKLPIVEKFDLSSLKRIISGAAPLDAKTEAALQAKFPHSLVGQGYGMTESSPIVSVSPSMSIQRDPSHSGSPPGTSSGRDGHPGTGAPGDSGTAGDSDTPWDSGVPGSAGTLMPLTEAKIVDLDSGRAIDPSHPGELWVRGPQVMQGYLNKPEATAATITPDGWLRTGDIGYFDRRGNLFLVDRAKELIKFKGFQVPPAELEGLLISHPGVTDAAVVPQKDDKAGEVPVAFVVRSAGASTSEAELLKFVASQVAPYKRLKSIQFVDAIPKSASGKILRRELKARL